MKIKIKPTIAKNDPEKAVLPAIIYLSDKNKRGFAIAIGWWHYGINIIFLYDN